MEHFRNKFCINICFTAIRCFHWVFLFIIWKLIFGCIPGIAILTVSDVSCYKLQWVVYFFLAQNCEVYILHWVLVRWLRHFAQLNVDHTYFWFLVYTSGATQPVPRSMRTYLIAYGKSVFHCLYLCNMHFYLCIFKYVLYGADVFLKRIAIPF